VFTPAQRAYIESLRSGRPCSLTPEQTRQLQQLHEEFERVNAADLALEREAMVRVAEAIRNGATREEIEALLIGVRESRERLAIARARLMEQVRTLLGDAGCALTPPPPPPGATR
jgi:hypothetical protein